jgi:hypothetical protein
MDDVRDAYVVDLRKMSLVLRALVGLGLGPGKLTG